MVTIDQLLKSYNLLVDMIYFELPLINLQKFKIYTNKAIAYKLGDVRFCLTQNALASKKLVISYCFRLIFGFKLKVFLHGMYVLLLMKYR